MKDNDLYARDDGSLVTIEQCTREELLICVQQYRQQEKVLRAHIDALQQSHDETRKRAYQHVAGVVAALSN